MSHDNDAPEERSRVFSRIAPIVMLFRYENPDGLFHIEDLREYVIEREPGIAPDSPGRILRELRLQGRLNYVVLNRRQSLYQFRPLDPLPAPPEQWFNEAKQADLGL